MPSSKKTVRVPKKAIKNASPKIGRPRIYTPDLLDKLAKHLEEWVKSNIETDNKLFLLGDWCFEVGFNMSYFHLYTSENENFKHAYEWAKQWQEHQVSKGALTNKLNPRFAQFFLSCNHKWRTVEESILKEEKEKSRMENVSDALHVLQRNLEAIAPSNKDE